MCGRYTLTVDQEALTRALGVERLLGGPELHPRPRFNVAPTQPAPILLPGRVLVAHRWGLVPPWAKDERGGARLINARSETVDRKPSFRDAFRSGRCLVPVDGFYEWAPTGGGSGAGPRVPHWIHLPRRTLFTLAGLRARWVPPEGGAPLETFTILTCEAAPEIRDLHPRMPVLVPSRSREAWLSGEIDAGGGLQRLVEAAVEAASALVAHPVTPRVNRPVEDDPGLIEPHQAPAPSIQGSLFDS